MPIDAHAFAGANCAGMTKSRSYDVVMTRQMNEMPRNIHSI